MSDDELKNHIDSLEDDRIRILWDATYFFMENQHGIKAMQETYSNQKKRPLTKAHIHCSTNGYIIDVGDDIFNGAKMTHRWPG